MVSIYLVKKSPQIDYSAASDRAYADLIGLRPNGISKLHSGASPPRFLTLKQDYLKTYSQSLPDAQAMIQAFVDKMAQQYSDMLDDIVSDLQKETGRTGMSNNDFAHLINKTELEYHFEHH